METEKTGVGATATDGPDPSWLSGDRVTPTITWHDAGVQPVDRFVCARRGSFS